MLTIKPDYTINLTRGDTAYLSVNYNKKYHSGDKLTISVKKSLSNTAYDLNKTIEANECFTFLPEDTKELKTGRYFYDIQLNTSLGEVFTLIGPCYFNILGEVTNE